MTGTTENTVLVQMAIDYLSTDTVSGAIKYARESPFKRMPELLATTHRIIQSPDFIKKLNGNSGEHRIIDIDSFAESVMMGLIKKYR